MGLGFSGLATFYSDFMRALDAADRCVYAVCVFYLCECVFMFVVLVTIHSLLFVAFIIHTLQIFV